MVELGGAAVKGTVGLVTGACVWLCEGSASGTEQSKEQAKRWLRTVQEVCSWSCCLCGLLVWWRRWLWSQAEQQREGEVLAVVKVADWQ